MHPLCAHIKIRPQISLPLSSYNSNINIRSEQPQHQQHLPVMEEPSSQPIRKTSARTNLAASAMRLANGAAPTKSATNLSDEPHNPASCPLHEADPPAPTRNPPAR